MEDQNKLVVDFILQLGKLILRTLSIIQLRYKWVYIVISNIADFQILSTIIIAYVCFLIFYLLVC